MKRTRYILLSAALLSANAQAALIAYEGFDPAPSIINVVGTGAGTGFSANWADSTGGGAILRSSDNNNMVAFPSNVTFATPAGGKAQINPSPGANTVTRTLSTTIDLSTAGSFYLSFLFNDYATVADANRIGQVFLGSASQRLQVGIGLNEAANITRTDGSNNSVAVSNGSTTYGGLNGDPLLFMVAEFNTVASGNDTIRLKAYSFTPGGGTVDLSPSAVTWDATHSFDGSGTLDQLGINLSNQYGEVDELRLGTTWADVTSIPEPSAVLLGGLGLLALLRRRR